LGVFDMRAIVFFNYIAAFFLTAFPQFVFSDDYYSWVILDRGHRFEASTPVATCQGFLQMRGGPSNGWYYNSVELLTDSSFDCWYDIYPAATKAYSFSGIRLGSSCPPGTTQDPTTGACEAPPPDCPVGDLFPARGSNGSVINSGGTNYVLDDGPPSICYNQCTYNGADYTPASSCYFVNGSTDTGFCNYVLKSTGGSCGADSYEFAQSGDLLNPPQTPNVPPSDPNDPGCPAGWSWSGTTCVKNPDDDGGDGGGGDGPGNGGGDTGDGEGQCDPAKDPNKCGQSSVSGEACNVDLKCEGDAIQCAILRMNKEQLCQWTYDASVKQQIADELSGEAYQLQETNIPVSGLFSEALNKGRWLPQTCPAPQTINVMGNTYSFSWEPVCRFATAMGPIIVALASIFFAVYIGRALKGS